ncbi:CoxG family protein [Algihabitans albus]|uniref:CoxG family protein n=1 Tax=Algihabitans albus TaxID=2164067 RepID=UPI000E5CB8CC|nr:carbon monoxide dehydrogenase subunit G [Algihabitans albus]
MELTGERKIQASRETVFAALNDPDILRQAIPGCENLEKTADNAFDAVVTLKVGPVKAKFRGAVTLDDLNPPESYTLAGEGKGGAAGFASGKAEVKLEEEADGTLLKYAVHANLGGKIAQLGSRLVQGTANKLSAEFFSKFAALVEGDMAATRSAPAEAGATSAPIPATVAGGTAAVTPPPTVEAGAAPTPIPAAAAAPGNPPSPSATSSQAAAAPASGGTPGWLWWAVGGIGLVVVVAFALL